MVGKHFLKLFYFLFVVLNFICSGTLFSQGLNHNWLIGYSTGVDTNVVSTRGRLTFDQSNLTVMPATFKMKFLASQANISDSNGNLLFVTNGCWIADATLDTMSNGAGLNPGTFTNSWCPSGIPYVQSNIALPFPDDSLKYILFHQTGNSSLNSMSSELYYSIIDMNLSGGLGAVVQKNQIAIQDTLNPGITACKHANGRDWWVVILKDSTDIIYKLLVTPTGISNISTQSLGMSPHNLFNAQLAFSPDGKKFAYHFRIVNSSQTTHEIRLFNFDRCSGQFFNGSIVTAIDPYSGLGLIFSPNSKYLYFDTYYKIFQLNTDTSNIPASLVTVAVNDTFYSPFPPLRTDFWHMYLGANGKVYVSSGSSVIDMHVINNPDVSGTSCDVQQHSITLPCYYTRGHVNHPNYNLGCDTTSSCPCLISGMEENIHDFKFSLGPNPNNGQFSVTYLLPQNKSGKLQVYDLHGAVVYEMILPPWSTLQQVNLSEGISAGIYNCVITSGEHRVNKKLAVLK